MSSQHFLLLFSITCIIGMHCVQRTFKLYYYMASSTSGQDESNPALWLATQVGKMDLSCLLGTTCRVPQEKFTRKPYNKSFIDQACLVKMAWYWPRSFFASLWTFKKELGQYPAILTSHLVNNPYVFISIMQTFEQKNWSQHFFLRDQQIYLVEVYVQYYKITCRLILVETL